MPKYDSFEIWPLSQNPLSVEWEWAQFWAPEGKRVYVPLLEFLPMAKHASVMPKYGNFENQPLSRKPLPIEQKYAQFRRSWIQRECMSLLLELWPTAKLVVKQSAKPMGLLFFFFFFFLFSFLLTGDHVGAKISNNILSESDLPKICSPKLKNTHRKGLCKSCIKKLRKFQIWISSSVWVIRCISDFRWPCILKMAIRRAKRTKSWTSGVSIQCIKRTFDC